MVKIKFVDGTSEIIEAYKGTTFQWNEDCSCFKVVEFDGKSFYMFPREFIKSIQYIGV